MTDAQMLILWVRSVSRIYLAYHELESRLVYYSCFIIFLFVYVYLLFFLFYYYYHYYFYYHHHQ